MNKITCDICRDLIPLVKDGIASDDSTRAVAEHIKECDNCRTLLGEILSPAANTDIAFKKFTNQIRTFSVMLMMFGLLFGFGLTAGSEIFYNSIIMPAIGALGYIIFGWKAVYEVPILLLITSYILNSLHMIKGAEHLDIYSLLIWTGIYTVFVLIGVAIASLIHYAFRKD